MSHFTVLVPAKDEDDLEAKLLPYHEYESTGIEDYTEEIILHRADEFAKDAQGIVDDLLGDDLREKYEQYIAEEDYAQLFSDWEGGYLQESTGHWVRRTNPNKKWDWWQVGGRWSGLLALKSVPAPPLLRGNTEVAGLNRNEVDFLVDLYKNNGGKFERVIAKYGMKATEIRRAVEQIADHNSGDVLPQGELGNPGVFGEGYNRSNGRADTALMREVDWDGMRQEREDGRAKDWDNWATALAAGNKTPEWYFEDFEPRWRAACDADDADAREAMREEWRSIRVANHDNDELRWALDLEPGGATRDDHINAEHALTFAFVDLEGKWNERGNMGWWAIVTDKNPDYDEIFWRFIGTLSDDQRIYVVDCHI